MLATATSAPAIGQEVDQPPDLLVIRPTIRATYDDNMLKLSKIRAPSDRDDLRFTPTIDFTVRRLIAGQHQLTLTGMAGYDLHRTNKFLNRERIEATAQVNVVVAGACTVRPEASVNWAQANLSDQGFVVGNTLRQTDLEVTVACRRAAGLYPIVSGRISRAINTAQSRELFNLHNEFASAGVGYRVPSIGDLVATVEYERFDRPEFRSRLGIDDRSTTWRYGLLFTRNVAPRVSFRAAANYFTVDPRAAGLDDFSGVGFEAGVNFRPSPALSINFRGARAATSQGNTGSTYVIQTRWQLTASYRLGAETEFQLGAQLNRRRFMDELLVDTPFPRDFDRTWTFNAGVTRALSEKIRAGVSARYERRNANIAYYEYHSASVTAQIGVRL